MFLLTTKSKVLNYNKETCLTNTEVIMNGVADNTGMFKSHTTGDVTWYMEVFKRSNTRDQDQSKDQTPEKTCQDQSNVKVILTILFNSDGMVH